MAKAHWLTAVLTSTLAAWVVVYAAAGADGPASRPVTSAAMAPAASGPTSLPVSAAFVDAEAASTLASADTMIRSGDLAKAMQLLQPLLDQRAATGLVASEDDPRRLLGVRAAVAAKLRSDPAALRQYREINEPVAGQLCQTAMQTWDVDALCQLAKRYPGTKAAADAWVVAGMICLEQGRADEAIDHWQQAALAGADRGLTLARIATAHQLAGRAKQAAEIAKDIQAHYAQQPAQLGGKATTLGEFAARVSLITPWPRTEIAGWPGDGTPSMSAGVMPRCDGIDSLLWQVATRTGPQPGRMEYALSYGKGSFAWATGDVAARNGHVEATGGDLINSPRRTFISAGFVHPILDNNVLLYRLDDGVVAADAATGKALWQTPFPVVRDLAAIYREKKKRGQNIDDLPRPPTPVPDLSDKGRHAITLYRGAVYAVGGFLPVGVWLTSKDLDLQENSSLVAYSVAQRGKVLWTQGWRGDTRELRDMQFVSAPVCRDGKLYVVGYAKDNYLLCLDAGTGSLIWKSVLSASRGGPTARFAIRLSGAEAGVWYAPPVLLGGRVYVSANGTVNAMDARDGETLWSYLCPDGLDGKPAPDPTGKFLPLGSSVNPLVVADDRVVCLPRDTDVLFALDVRDGKLLWQIDRDSQRHLNVIDGGRVLLSDPGIVMIDAATGKALHKADKSVLTLNQPAVTPDEALLSGPRCVWRLKLSDYSLTKVALPTDATLGNLVSCGGRLFSAGPLGICALGLAPQTQPGSVETQGLTK